MGTPPRDCVVILSLIAAMAKGRVIGVDNRMPWHLPADLRHFKDLTWGKSVVMGRQTYLSLGKPLPGRRNIVLTHDVHFSAPGCVVVHEWSQVEVLCAEEEEVMVIGGQTLYEQTLPLAKRLYLTEIDLSVQGDRFFPEWDENEWQLMQSEFFHADEKNPYAYRFSYFERTYSAVFSVQM